jgi:hypothetical protein
MSGSGDPQLDEKIAEVAKFLSKKELLNTSTLDPIWFAGLKPETQVKIAEDMKKAAVDSDFQALREDVINITQEMLRQPSGYGTPFRTLGKYEAEAKEKPIANLRQGIEAEEAEISNINDAIVMFRGGITEQVKQEILNGLFGRSVMYKIRGFTWTKTLNDETAWNDHEKESLEKIQILKVGRLFHEKVIQIFNVVITEREAMRPEIEKRIHAAAKLCDEAEKVIEKIRKAEQPFRDGNFGNIKAAKEFVHGWQRLEQLRTEFSTLRGSGVEFADFGHPEPVFADFSALVFTETDVQRKARIFKIIEDIKKQV